MQLVIKLLGRFEVWLEGQFIENWPRQKTQELLKLLVSERGRSFSQDQLIESFFPDLNPARAVNNLQKRVSELRRTLEPELTKGTDSQFVLQAGSREQGYYFSQEVSCQLDTEEFQTHLEAAHAAEQAERWAQVTEHYQRAVELYRGDFLADALYEEWTIAPRERWKEKYLSALMRLAEAHARLGQLSSAIECCEKVLEKEAWNEHVIRQKMLYLYHLGNQPKALDMFKTCVEALQKHLGVEPTLETRQLYEQILKHQVPPLLRAIPNNLPQQLTSFIGREREIEEIKHLILDVGAQHAAPLQRLVTLTGVGGCGKTRLGLQIASQLLKEYADGVWWVELASLADPNLVVQAIASALGVKEQPGRSLLSAVTDYLHSKQLLLVLDNCEHLVEACAKVVQELLKACPKLQILVTSREPLGILGETVWQVPPLSVPDTPSLPAVGPELVSALQEYESVSLFVERARANESKFRLSEENARATAQICYQLDGIPLAIELAAARVRALSVEQIAARLDDRFRLLTGGNRAALPRHQTLQATMDWSYQLLAEKEQALLRKLSVFAGGWTLEAAEEVCADELIQSQEVMELLAHLVDKSLVLVEKRGEAPRYKLLETVRQYGIEKLKEAKETENAQSRHLDYFLKLAGQAMDELFGPNSKTWFDILEREHGNLRTALRWVLESEEVEKGLRLAVSLGQFWLVRGHWAEGQEILLMLLQVLDNKVEISKELKDWKASACRWAGALISQHKDYEQAKRLFNKSLELSQEIGDKNSIASSLNTLGVTAFKQGNYAVARTLLEQSLAIYQELGVKQAIAFLLNNLGNIAAEQGDYAVSRKFHERSLAIQQERGDKWGVAMSHNNLGDIAKKQGDYATAQAFHEQALAIRRELGDKQGIAYSLNNLGMIAQDEGDYVIAKTYHEQSLAIRQELGDKQGIAQSLSNMGLIAQKQGNYTVAEAFHERGLVLMQEVGDKQGIANSLTNLGGVACKQGHYAIAQRLFEQGLLIQQEIGDKFNLVFSLEEIAKLAYTQKQIQRTVRILGAAETLREAINSPIPPADHPNYDRTVSALHTSLGEQAFTKAWAEGRAMTLDQAIAYALEATASTENTAADVNKV